jgi:cell division protein FtsW
MKPVGWVVGVFGALILLEPDLGTTIALCLMVAGLLLVSGTPVRVLTVATALALGLGAAAIWFEPYRRERLLSFLDPWQDPEGAGFQSVQAMIGIGSGGITGEGLGQGIQKINFLPEAHTDMIFAVIGEELGLVGITAVVGLFALLAYAGLQIARKAKDRYGKILVAGLTSLIVIQAMVNLFAVMGLAPLTGVPLPFVSYGNNNLLVLLFSVGLMLNVSRGGTAGAGKLRVVEGGRKPARGRSKSSGARARKSGGGGRGNGRTRRAGHGGRRRASR